MNLETILKLFKDYGVTAVLFLWILRNEARINVVEDKLYNCYTTMHILTADDSVKEETKLIAIIPHDIYTKKHIQRYITAK